MTRIIVTAWESKSKSSLGVQNLFFGPLLHVHHEYILTLSVQITDRQGTGYAGLCTAHVDRPAHHTSATDSQSASVSNGV